MPENYIQPANERPRLSEVVTEEIPFFDLGGEDRSQIIRQIGEARRSHGFIQIINHVGDRVINVPGNQVDASVSMVLSKPSVGEFKDMKLDQKDIFKVAIPSVTVSAAEIIGDHAVGLSLDAYHDFLLKACAVVNFAIFIATSASSCSGESGQEADVGSCCTRLQPYDLFARTVLHVPLSLL